MKVAITGAAGRMGRRLIRGVLEAEDMELVAAIERADHPEMGRDAGTLAGLDAAGVPVTDSLDSIAEADVLIDFTFHNAVPAHAEAAARGGVALVLGTTGLAEAEAAVVRKTAESVPVVWAPNMSVGVNLLFALVRKTASILGPSYDIEIIETHHRHKKDAPSGTARRLAEKAAEGRGRSFDEIAVFGRVGITGERPVGEIGIHAVRAGDTVGDHTVLFATDGERVELAHRATSREAFSRGALHAARWVVGRPAGLYDMQDVLDLR